MNKKLFTIIAILVFMMITIQGSCFATVSPIKVIVSTESGLTGNVALNMGEQVQLRVSTLPENASTGKVSWKSSKSSVATVSASGLVYTKKAGKATISATSNTGKKTGKITITVINPTIPTRINFTQDTPTSVIQYGNAQLKFTLLPSSAYSDIRWSSSNTKIASVSNAGYLYAKKIGRVTITAAAVRGNAKSRIAMTVIPNPTVVTQISIDLPNKVNMDIGEEKVLKYNIQPKTAQYTISYSYSKKNIISISKGIITALNPGSTAVKITAKSKINGSTVSSSFVVSVSKNASSKNIEIVSVTENAPLYVNTQGSWYLNVINAKPPTTYKYAIYKNGNYQYTKSIQSPNFTSYFSEIGSYYIQATATDSRGVSSSITTKEFNITYKPITISSYAPDVTIYENYAKIVTTINVNGGNPPYNIKYEILKGNTLLNQYTLTNVYSYTSNIYENILGNYTIRFTVTDTMNASGVKEIHFTI